MSHSDFTRRALVVEDDPLTRSLIASLLEVGGFEVTSCGTAREAHDVFDAVDPDVLVVDIQLGQQPNGAQLAAALKAASPHMGVVVVSHYPTPVAAGRAHPLPSGTAFLNKAEVDSSDVLLDAIESALDDARAPIVRLARGASDLTGLTGVQLEVLKLIAMGCSNAEIARRRGVAKRTAEELVQRVYSVLGVAEAGSRNARVEATKIYVRAFGMPEDTGD